MERFNNNEALSASITALLGQISDPIKYRLAFEKYAPVLRAINEDIKNLFIQPERLISVEGIDIPYFEYEIPTDTTDGRRRRPNTGKTPLQQYCWKYVAFFRYANIPEVIDDIKNGTSRNEDKCREAFVHFKAIVMSKNCMNEEQFNEIFHYPVRRDRFWISK